MSIALRTATTGLSAAILFLAAACTDVVRRHGYTPSDPELSQIEVGATGRDDVVAIAGNPAHIDERYGESWFYVSSRFRISGANEPEEVERRIVEVAFSDNGKVSNVATYSLEDGRVIPLTRRVTENNLGRVTILEQLGRAFGRIDPGAILTGE